MPLFVGDYLRDTVHLQTVEHGAYMLILMALWSQDGAIKSDPKYLARVTRMTPTKFKNAWAEIGTFFEDDGAMLTHPRITKELAKSLQIRAKNSQNAKSRWQKKPSKNNKSSDATALQLQSIHPKGMDITTNVVNIHSLAPEVAHSFETMRANAADSAQAWEIDHLQKTITGAEGETLYVESHQSAMMFTDRIGVRLDEVGLKLAVQKAPSPKPKSKKKETVK